MVLCIQREFGTRVWFFQVVDQLVDYLQAKQQGSKDLVLRVQVQAYKVLETYLQGNSRKNELYFAQHIGYFSTQYEKQVREEFLSDVLIDKNPKFVHHSGKGPRCRNLHSSVSKLDVL